MIFIFCGPNQEQLNQKLSMHSYHCFHKSNYDSLWTKTTLKAEEIEVDKNRSGDTKLVHQSVRRHIDTPVGCGGLTVVKKAVQMAFRDTNLSMMPHMSICKWL